MNVDSLSWLSCFVVGLFDNMLVNQRLCADDFFGGVAPSFLVWECLL
jgi:hypothetical protein